MSLHCIRLHAWPALLRGQGQTWNFFYLEVKLEDAILWEHVLVGETTTQRGVHQVLTARCGSEIGRERYGGHGIPTICCCHLPNLIELRIKALLMTETIHRHRFVPFSRESV